MSEDDRSAGQEHAGDLAKSPPRQWCPFTNNASDALVGQGNCIGSPDDEPRDRLPRLRTGRFDAAWIEVPSRWIPPFTANVEQDVHRIYATLTPVFHNRLARIYLATP
jgi:hypothetical protein